MNAKLLNIIYFTTKNYINQIRQLYNGDGMDEKFMEFERYCKRGNG